MNNTYIYLIWPKALWCKDKIVNDLEKSFVIKKQFYIEWQDDAYEENLKALYGRKIGIPKEKIRNCGKGRFFILLTEDPNPNIQIRDMYDGQEEVNSNVYDKKMLYRKWTAGAHRIHCSDTKLETLHDFSILFGSKYEEIINSIEPNSTLKLDTKAIVGFSSLDELVDSLLLFGNNKTYVIDNNLFIFTKYHLDISYYLNANKISDNKYILNINNKEINIYIFGEADGDLPNGTYKILNDEIVNAIINNVESYTQYLNNRNVLSDELTDCFKSYNLETSFSHINILRDEKKTSIFRHLIMNIKLLLYRIKG